MNHILIMKPWNCSGVVSKKKYIGIALTSLLVAILLENVACTTYSCQLATHIYTRTKTHAHTHTHTHTNTHTHAYAHAKAHSPKYRNLAVWCDERVLWKRGDARHHLFCTTPGPRERGVFRPYAPPYRLPGVQGGLVQVL